VISGNPFSEPDDSNKTIIIPAPGGVNRKPPQAGAATQGLDTLTGQQEPLTPQGPAEIPCGRTPLLQAASKLLQLLARIRNTVRPPDPGDLRERAIAELQRFEKACRDYGVAAVHVEPAHYALCAALDDVALNTPWGAQGSWAAASLVSTFHHQVRAGEEFFKRLRFLSQSPAAMLPVLELMYMCLALGFQGQYRLPPMVPADLDRVREELYTLISRHLPRSDPTLSANWRGVDAPYRPLRAEVPAWVAGSCAAAALFGLFVAASLSLGKAVESVSRTALVVPPEGMPRVRREMLPPADPAPRQSGPVERLRERLAPDIPKLVEVDGPEATPKIRISYARMFASGSAVVAPELDGLLKRVGKALNPEMGSVTIEGYTDNRPINTLKFPSNQSLSLARAQAAGVIVKQAMDDPGRVSAEGLGELNPVDDNGTDLGRQHNRRIDVVLHSQE